MNWHPHWRITDTIKPNRVYVVQSLIDGSNAVLKTSREHGVDIAREIEALERMNATGASVPTIIEHNSTTFRSSDASLFVAMEYVAGATLWEYALTNTVTHDQLAAVADVVRAAHSIGLTHGDLTSSNVVVRIDGTPIVCDWARGLLRHAIGTSFPLTDELAWAEAVQEDLLSLEKLPMTLKTEFVAKGA